MLDSDTVWAPGALREMLRPFADPRVGGVTPRQAIFDVGDNPVRRLADWIEDIRYHLTVPAQSVFGQVGCLAGRTIAYRRTAFEPAVERLVRQTVLGVPQHVGDDRVLTNELLRDGWRTVYQSTALVETDAPSDWRTFWRQQLRWGRSSQRETLLSLRWLWRRPVAFVSFADRHRHAVRALRGRRARGRARAPRARGATGLPLAVELPLGYLGMLGEHRPAPDGRTSGACRATCARLPLFVLQITFVMVPIRIAAFATMFHQDWGSRGDRPARSRASRLPIDGRARARDRACHDRRVLIVNRVAPALAAGRRRDRRPRAGRARRGGPAPEGDAAAARPRPGDADAAGADEGPRRAGASGSAPRCATSAPGR